MTNRHPKTTVQIGIYFLATAKYADHRWLCVWVNGSDLPLTGAGLG